MYSINVCQQKVDKGNKVKVRDEDVANGQANSYNSYNRIANE